MQLNYPSNLPITARKEAIIQAIQEHQVIVVAGATGSGKTTQLPKMCLDAGRAEGRAIIGCTQPRRIAAMSVAERVQEELGEQGVPDLVGYKIRFHDHTGSGTKIKFMTDGILLAETQGDRELRRYDTIIIDEAHERSLNIDFLLGYLHRLLATRRDLKLIIASATIDTEKFSRHFHDAPIIEVSGRTYPVTFQYRPGDAAGDETGDAAQDICERATEEVRGLADRPGGGDILVFMPTERDILDTVTALNKSLRQTALVLPLFGRLHGKEQRRIFQSSPLRKIIVATNVAETSITVPGIETVVDTGLARISHYNVRAGTTHLPVTRVSKASCDQRAGRCGRIGPGTCVRLYSEEEYLARPEFTQPELLRSNLAEVILRMISLRLPDPREFPFIDPPSPRAVNDGYRILRELGALTEEHQLTARGRIMAGLPLDPRISRMIIEGAELGVLRQTMIIAAALAVQDPRVQPVDKKEKARQAHRAFIHPGSDVLTLVNIWDSCKSAMRDGSPSAGLRRFCKDNFCSWQRMREWFDIHEQLVRILKQHKEIPAAADPPTSAGADEDSQAASVHQALTAGFLRNIALRKEKNSYQISGDREATLFPGSCLYNKGGQWIVAVDFVHTSRLFARTAVNIDVSWLEALGGELCKRSWSDPAWRGKTGQVTALEKVSLFGLVITANRRVNYGRINSATAAEAREIFIREALISGSLTGSYPFLRHNLALAKSLDEMEERLRRRGIMMDDQVLYEFYDQRLGTVYDRFTLNRFLKNKGKKAAPGEERDGFLRMREEDICLNRPDSDELYRFPKTLRTDQGELRLHYSFQPGKEEDGVTVDIPVSCCPALSPALFEWLVPGLLEEKVLALLKGLPKRLRKIFVPLPDSVDQLMDSLDMYHGSLYPALERVIHRRFQVMVIRADWRLDNLPAHLRMRFRLCDEQGKTLRHTRDFHTLASCCEPGQAAAKNGATTSMSQLPEPRKIKDWDVTEPPQPIPVRDKQQRMTGLFYPALFIEQDKGQERSLSLQYIADFAEANSRNREGLRFLYGLSFPQEIKAITKECKMAVAGHTASWLSLGMKAGAAEIRNLLLSCILDSLFQLNTAGGELPNKTEVDHLVAELKEQGLAKLARGRLKELLNLLAARRQTQVVITQSKQRAGKNRNMDKVVFMEYERLLDGLVPADFLGTSGVEEPGDTLRYLQALSKRIERAEHAPHKDANKAKRLAPALARLQRISRPDDGGGQSSASLSSACRREVALYRRMLEEFRISIFAPEIRTAMPVSEKRLERQWRLVEDSCRRME